MDTRCGTTPCFIFHSKTKRTDGTYKLDVDTMCLVMGRLVASGYGAELTAQASQGVPAEAVAALNSLNALITKEALQGLADLMTQLPILKGLYGYIRLPSNISTQSRSAPCSSILGPEGAPRWNGVVATRNRVSKGALSPGRTLRYGVRAYPGLSRDEGSRCYLVTLRCNTNETLHNRP